MQRQRVVVGMVVRSNKIRVGDSPKKMQHLFELARQIEVVVLREVDGFSALLLQQDVYLLSESPPVSAAVQTDQFQVRPFETFRENVIELPRTSVQQNKHFDPQIPQRLSERAKAHPSQLKFVCRKYGGNF